MTPRLVELDELRGLERTEDKSAPISAPSGGSQGSELSNGSCATGFASSPKARLNQTSPASSTGSSSTRGM